MIVLKVTAARGSGNETVFDLIDSDGVPVDLTALGVTAATVSVCGTGVCGTTSIDSSTDDVTFSGSQMTVKFGQLALTPTRNPNSPYFPKISYTTAANPDPEVIAGQGYETEIQLRVVC